MSHISADDLTFYKEDGKIMSGGFNVSSILMKNGFISSNGQKGGGISSLFDNLAVPSGLLYQQQKGGDKDREPIYYDEIMENGEKKEEVLDEDIYEKLLKMIEVNEKSLKKQTRKSTIVKKGGSKTKKNL